jgi:hypothetical protein
MCAEQRHIPKAESIRVETNGLAHGATLALGRPWERVSACLVLPDPGAGQWPGSPVVFQSILFAIKYELSKFTCHSCDVASVAALEAG